MTTSAINRGMERYLIKILLSAVVIATVSELGKKSTWLAAILASLPLTSILALIWLYLDTRDVSKTVNLSRGIFWAVLPSLVFFLAFPLTVRMGLRFWHALTISCAMTFGAYWLYVLVLKRMGTELS